MGLVWGTRNSQVGPIWTVMMKTSALNVSLFKINFVMSQILQEYQKIKTAVSVDTVFSNDTKDLF